MTIKLDGILPQKRGSADAELPHPLAPDATIRISTMHAPGPADPSTEDEADRVVIEVRAGPGTPVRITLPAVHDD